MTYTSNGVSTTGPAGCANCAGTTKDSDAAPYTTCSAPNTA